MADRTRGVIVQVLDLDPVKAELLAHFQQKDPTISDLHFGGRWATATDPRGKTHLLSNEGVGAIFSDDDPCEVEVYADHEKDGKRTTSMFPEGIIRFTPSRLANLPTEDVDLADFIRTFGARLEQNFAENYKQLT